MAEAGGPIWYSHVLNPNNIADVDGLVASDIAQGIPVTYVDPETKQQVNVTFTGQYKGAFYSDFCVYPRVYVSDDQIQSAVAQILQIRENSIGRKLSADEEYEIKIGLLLILIAGIAFTTTAYFVTRWAELFVEHEHIQAQHYRDKQVYYDDRLRDDDGNLIPIKGYTAYLAYLQSHYPGDYSWLQEKGYTDEGSNWWEKLIPGGDITTLLIILGVFAIGALILVNVLPSLLRRPTPPAEVTYVAPPAPR